MLTMEHLDGIQRSKELGMYKAEVNIEDDVYHSMENYGHFVNQAMKKVCVCVCACSVLNMFVYMSCPCRTPHHGCCSTLLQSTGGTKGMPTMSWSVLRGQCTTPQCE